MDEMDLLKFGGKNVNWGEIDPTQIEKYKELLNPQTVVSLEYGDNESDSSTLSME